MGGKSKQKKLIQDQMLLLPKNTHSNSMRIRLLLVVTRHKKSRHATPINISLRSGNWVSSLDLILFLSWFLGNSSCTPLVPHPHLCHMRPGLGLEGGHHTATSALSGWSALCLAPAFPSAFSSAQSGWREFPLDADETQDHPDGG